MTSVAWAHARRTQGVTQTVGLLVARPGVLVFLPTLLPRNITGAMALVVVGVHRVDGDPKDWKLEERWEQGAESFDRFLHHNGVTFERGSRYVLTEHPHDSVVLQNQDDGTDVITAEPLPARLLEGWPTAPPIQDMAALAKVFAGISVVPLALAAICGVVAFFGDDKSAYWGIPFWGILVVPLWVTFAWQWRKAKRQEAERGPG